jgi:hypothetical protein
MPEDLAVRLLSLLPDLEVIVGRERDGFPVVNGKFSALRN